VAATIWLEGEELRIGLMETLPPVTKGMPLNRSDERIELQSVEAGPVAAGAARPPADPVGVDAGDCAVTHADLRVIAVFKGFEFNGGLLHDVHLAGPQPADAKMILKKCINGICRAIFQLNMNCSPSIR